MHRLELKEAGSRLAELVEEAASGEEVVITRKDGAVFKIVAVKPEEPRPKFGSARGLIEMSDDFDDPVADFNAYGP